MRNQHYYGYNPSPEYSPLRDNNILRVDDIQGAKPRHGLAYKNTAHYENRLANNSNNNIFEANLQMHEKLYALGNYHQGYNPAFSSKKHYIVHQESEIARTGVLNGRESAPPNLHYADFPRNLTTNDIPGATPGSLQSKTVKNHDLAHKLRGNSVTPVPTQPSKDSLDNFQKSHNVTEEDYKFNIPPRDSYPVPRGTNFHYAQNQKNNDQQTPASAENYYSTPTVVTQQDHRETTPQADLSFNEGKKVKHVVFKEEPREQKSQLKEHPGQFRDHSPLREQPNQYREQSNEILQKDYLDSYVAQNREQTRLNTGHDESFQEYPNPSYASNPRPSYHSKKEELEQLSREILTQQQALERKVRDTVRNRAFNIISNAPMGRHQLERHRGAYGSSIKALQKNQEDFGRRDNSASRAWAATPEINSSSRQADLSAHSYLEPRKNNFAAGAMNEYLDSSFRNTNNNLTQLPPIAQGQYYGSKAVKNLNGVKLY